MADPTDAQIVAATKDMVALARKNGQLEHYTRGFVRESLERDFKLPAGSLKPRKRVVNTAIEEAIAAGSEQPDDDNEAGDGEAPPPKEKENLSPPVGAKRKAKAKPTHVMESDTELSVLEDRSPVKNKAKRTKTAPGKKLSTGNTKAKRADKNTDAFLGMIGLAPGSRGADEETAALLLNGLTRGRAAESDSEPPIAKKSKPKKDSGEPKKPKNGSKSKLKDTSGQASGSEMSVLEDEAPKKKRAKKSEKSDKPMDKDDEQVKRLKSFVVACGVRKKWAKEFEGLTTPSQQVARLRKILADLGMTGRLSLEKAKEIKERRDLAQEMEDVLEFDSKINGSGRASRSSRGGAASKRPTVADSDQEEGDEDGGADSPGPSTGRKRPHKNNNILAFLADQSESE